MQIVPFLDWSTVSYDAVCAISKDWRCCLLPGLRGTRRAFGWGVDASAAIPPADSWRSVAGQSVWPMDSAGAIG
jgi:hypothetical protein